MELSIRIVDHATPALAAIERRIPDALEEGTHDATTLVLREMQLYPPQRLPRGNREPYRRTGTLKRSWFRRVRRVGGGAVGEVVSSGQIAPYNIYVQHHALQAATFAGYWRTEEQVVTALRPQIVEMYERRIGAAVSVR